MKAGIGGWWKGHGVGVEKKYSQSNLFAPAPIIEKADAAPAMT
jgi:hypothetical protein